MRLMEEAMSELRDAIAEAQEVEAQKEVGEGERWGEGYIDGLETALTILEELCKLPAMPV